MTTDTVKITRALISVSDKTRLEEIAFALHAQGVEIISSGGTLQYLAVRNIPVTPIEKVTGNPESFGGRMKTLSFQVGSAILFRRDNAQDVKEAENLGVRPIDLVICNLYPFEAAAQKKDAFDEWIENIDIGGPTLIRAAAKNHAAVAVVTDPSQYAGIIEELAAKGGLGLALRQSLCLAAFRYTARYDGAIAGKLEDHWHAENKTITIPAAGGKALRYGENPHQKARVYADPLNAGLAGLAPLQGKEMSYNNYLDADAAWHSCGDITLTAPKNLPAAVSVIKHLNPCGAALAATPLAALQQAWAGDPVSSFGSIICFNKPVDEETAKWLANRFVEVIIAPGYSDAARQVFASKANLRLLEMPPFSGDEKAPVVRSISGGWLVQQEDNGPDTELKTVTSTAFPAQHTALAHFGIMVCKHLKSNAIGIFSAADAGFSLIGAGMGNPNRLVSMAQATDKARENGHTDLSKAVLVSDAFFPFPDNIDIASAAGIKFIIQPGGSIKDKEVIAACDAHGIAMAFTGRRHFRH